MSYFRKMIYLQEEGQERGGYIKASGKREWIRLEVHLKNVNKWGNKPVTLVLKGQKGTYNQLAGTISSEEITRLECKAGEKEEVVGIWIGEHGKAQMGESQPPVAESAPLVEEKTEEEVVVAELVQKQQEKIPETTEPEIETAETEEPPEFIEVEMEEEHNWDYECRKILESHTAMYPFSDDEVDQCVQIGGGFWRISAKVLDVVGKSIFEAGILQFWTSAFCKSGRAGICRCAGKISQKGCLPWQIVWIFVF